jgi:two-component system sensor histidine kinase UhpB
VRELLRRLRPSADATSGVPLKRLLEEIVASWRDRPGQRTNFVLDEHLGDRVLPDDLSLALFRLTQEALTNATRHAEATRVVVHVGTSDAGDVEWSVEDDGVGIDAIESASHRGSGLAGMRERVWAHGGEIEIVARDATAARPGLRIAARFKVV